MPKSWIVKETGIYDFVQYGVHFENGRGYLSQWTDNEKSINKHPILSVTPLPTREEMVGKFITWNNMTHDGFAGSHIDAWLACYDLLFGPQSTPETWKDDWF